MNDETKRIEEELEMLRDQHGGVVPPEAVVEFARDPATALHAKFEWDDEKAAHEHRLNQARFLLRTIVKYEEHVHEPVRVYVSLPSDRKPGGGYRVLAQVMSDEDRRAELMRMALTELCAVKRKYAQLSALNPVFREIDKAQQQFDFEHSAEPAAEAGQAVA